MVHDVGRSVSECFVHDLFGSRVDQTFRDEFVGDHARCSGAPFAEFAPENVSRLLHELVAVPPSLENSWLDTTGAVGNFTFGHFLEDRQAVCFDVVAGDLPAAYEHPTRKHKLTSTGKTDLTRLLVVQQFRSGSRCADQVVTQNRGPQFFANHLRRLVAHMRQIQRLFDRPDV